MRSHLPLTGIKVIDLSRILAGPLCSMTLGDFGAEVIKIEHPARGDDTRGWGIEIAPGETTYFYSINRNKRSVTLDLSTLEGQEMLRDMVRNADVVVENFKAGGMEQFGLGYEDLKAINRKLVYCSIAGYDRYGPERDRPGYDLVIQGESGLMSINGEPDGNPVKFGVAAVDMFAGMFAAQAVLAGLYQVATNGKGVRIDVALYDCGVAISSYYGLEALIQGVNPPRYGNAHPSVVPYGVFNASDGPLVIAVGNDRQFRDFCSVVLDRPDISDDLRFTTNLKRMEHRATLLPEIDKELLKRTRSDLLQAMSKLKIPSGQVLGLYDALVHDRTVDAQIVETKKHPMVGGVHVLAPPVRLDGRRLPVKRPPGLGEGSIEE